MKFDIILHGKPNAGSHMATDGMNETFCQNIVENFFQFMGHVKENKILIVDARNWKGAWYSVYTLWFGRNIKDTVSRESYLALSIVLPNQYLCLVSDVYDVLQKALKQILIGTYISEEGKYLVQNFENSSAFEKLVSFINDNIVCLIDSFDSSFISNLNYK